MTEKEIIRTSKFLSLILRHEPERVGLTLDSAGWVAVDELLRSGCRLAGGQGEEVGEIVDDELVLSGVPVTVYDVAT